LRWFFELLSLAAFLYQLAVLIYFAIGFINPAQSGFTHFLNRIVEPLLIPLRRILANILPANWQRMDWSPLAAWLVIWMVRELLGILGRMFG
jgi:uncharacterized protein YggT (Ycf19 family)